MQELVAILVLLLALIVVMVAYNMKPHIPSPPPPVVSQAMEPQTVPIYFPRPFYPFPRLNYPIRGFTPPMRPPMKY